MRMNVNGLELLGPLHLLAVCNTVPFAVKYPSSLIRPTFLYTLDWCIVILMDLTGRAVSRSTSSHLGLPSPLRVPEWRRWSQGVWLSDWPSVHSCLQPHPGEYFLCVQTLILTYSCSNARKSSTLTLVQSIWRDIEWFYWRTTNNILFYYYNFLHMDSIGPRNIHLKNVLIGFFYFFASTCFLKRLVYFH